MWELDVGASGVTRRRGRYTVLGGDHRPLLPVKVLRHRPPGMGNISTELSDPSLPQFALFVELENPLLIAARKYSIGGVWFVSMALSASFYICLPLH